jgi:hypothetical protein
MIETADFKVNYDCDGSTVRFDFTFPIFEDDNLDIRRYNSVTLEEEELIKGTDYYVEQATFGTWLDGGTVVTYDTYPSGDRISITRDVSPIQLLDYIENDPFPAESHERGLDKLTVLIQEVEEFISRVITIPKSDPSGFSLELAPFESRLGKFMQFDEVTGDLKVVTAIGAGLVVFTAWGEAFVGNANADEGMTQLGFSTFFKTLIGAVDGDALNVLTGAFDLTVNDLDDISDGATYVKITANDLAALKKGFIKVSLTLWDTENATAPQVAAGSCFEYNGVLVPITIDTSITGSLTSTSLNYIYWDGTQFLWSTTAPTWNDALQGFYNGSDRAIGGLYRTINNINFNKWIYHNRHTGPQFLTLDCPLVGIGTANAYPDRQYGFIRFSGASGVDDYVVDGIPVLDRDILVTYRSYCVAYTAGAVTVKFCGRQQTNASIQNPIWTSVFHNSTGWINGTNIINVGAAMREVVKTQQDEYKLFCTYEPSAGTTLDISALLIELIRVRR